MPKIRLPIDPDIDFSIPEASSFDGSVSSSSNDTYIDGSSDIEQNITWINDLITTDQFNFQDCVTSETPSVFYPEISSLSVYDDVSVSYESVQHFLENRVILDRDMTDIVFQIDDSLFEWL